MLHEFLQAKRSGHQKELKFTANMEQFRENESHGSGVFLLVFCIALMMHK